LNCVEFNFDEFCIFKKERIRFFSNVKNRIVCAAFFDNDCINSFNKSDNPIGICCNTVDEYVDRMEDIILNYARECFGFEDVEEHYFVRGTKYGNI
jgi:hypothetical protein